jgi:class I fructose-bisphosphate aldolase
MTGKAIRMERILNEESGRTVIVPLDHGVTVGPIEGLVSIKDIVSQAIKGRADAVLMHKGMIRSGYRGYSRHLGLVVHLSASTRHAKDSHAKGVVSSVEEAIKMGADAVSVHVNLGNMDEKEMLVDLGKITNSARDWGMPVLAMVYGRGPEMANPYDPAVVAHCARMGEELGADLVKVNYTGDINSFRKVVNVCSIPVVIAGGPKLEDSRDLLKIAEEAIKAGGAGLSIGRNVFQDDQPSQLLKELTDIVHNKKSEEAFNY